MHTQIYATENLKLCATEGAGARGRAAPPARPLPCPIHNNSAELLRPPMLCRSALACWFSIMHLIESTQGPCYLWTFTTVKPYPDHYFGNMHGNLTLAMKDESRKFSTGGKIPNDWGGVRVFEVHEKRKGGGLHAHWVMRGRMDWYTVSECAKRAGLGRVHVDPKPVTMRVAYYVASYLTKNGKLHGVRQWSNIGTYDGIGKRDIEMDSDRIRDIKAWQLLFRGRGDHRYLAYRKALQMVDEGIPLPGTVPF